MDEPKTGKMAGSLRAASLGFYAVLAAMAAAAGFLVARSIPERGSEMTAGAPAPAERLTYAASPSAGKLVRGAQPRAVPDLAFTGADGTQHRLSEWRGKVVLLNVWATWCAPCKTEMPSLDRLQAKLGGRGFAVLAISTDRGGPDKPQAFFAGNGIAHLAVYNDRTPQTAAALEVPGLPVSIILDRQGREVARLIGPADWDNAATAAAMDEFTGRDGGGG